jgi:hypothetical protein
MTRTSLPIGHTHEPDREVGIQSALILAFVDGEELRVLNATEGEVELESPDPIPPELGLELAVFNIAKWEYKEFRFERCRVVARQAMAFSEVCRIALGRNVGEAGTNYRECIARLKSMWETGLRRDGSAPAGFDDFPVYHAQKAKRSYATFDEQRRAWLSPAPSEEACVAFRELAERVEHAFSVCTPAGYDRLLRYGCAGTIDRVLEETGLSSHPLFATSFSRLYVGNEFCPHLFPEVKRLVAVLDAARREGLESTVVSPYLMEHTVESMKDLLVQLEAWSDASATRLEIVVNDWGTLELLNQFAPSSTPSLGKLLNKRKKDPRARWFWGYAKHELNLRENNLNVDWYRRFLRELGIERFEHEAGPMRARAPGPGHSLHYPYYYTNAGVFCALYAEVTEFYAGKQRLVKACPRYCTDFCTLYPDHLKLVGKGNHLWGFDDEILVEPTSLRHYIDQGIDRLVFMSDV